MKADVVEEKGWMSKRNRLHFDQYEKKIATKNGIYLQLHGSCNERISAFVDSVRMRLVGRMPVVKLPKLGVVT